MGCCGLIDRYRVNRNAMTPINNKTPMMMPKAINNQFGVPVDSITGVFVVPFFTVVRFPVVGGVGDFVVVFALIVVAVVVVVVVVVVVFGIRFEGVGARVVAATAAVVVVVVVVVVVFDAIVVFPVVGTIGGVVVVVTRASSNPYIRKMKCRSVQSCIYNS